MNKFLELAVQQARKSDMYHQHGAILFHGSEAVNYGHNRIDRFKLQRFNQMHSTHAEVDCSRRLLCTV